MLAAPLKLPLLLVLAAAAAAAAAPLPAAPADAIASANSCAPPPARPGLAGLSPCTFFSLDGGGGVSWHVRERACTPPREPLVPALPAPGQDPSLLLVASCPAPFGVVPPGTVVWASSSTADSLVVDGSGSSNISFEGVSCVGCIDLSASTPQQLLLPPALLRVPAGGLPPAEAAVRNSRLFASGPEAVARAAALFARVLAAPSLQQALAEWSLAVYTDGASYFVVPEARIGSLTLSGAGAFVYGPEPLQPPLLVPVLPAPGPGMGSFALGVNNDTFHRVLKEKGSVDTDVPFLIIVRGNVTLAPHPELPPGGFELRRPVTIMGRRGHMTGIDFGGRVNTIRLTGRGNLTFESLALDNLVAGDEESMQGVVGFSATLAYALWAVSWDRADRRLFVARCVLAVPEQTQIERLKYFMAIFNSADLELRKQAEWMRSAAGPRTQVATIAVDQRPGLAIVMFSHKAMAYKDTYVQSVNTVFPSVPATGSSNLLAQAEAAAAAVGTPLHVPPIIAVMNGPGDLMARTPLTRPSTILVVPAQGADLSPAPERGWPPPGGLEVSPGAVPNTLIFFGDFPNATANASSGAGTDASQQVSGGDGGGPTSGAAAAAPLPLPLPRPGAPAHHPLWLGFASGLIRVPSGSQEKVQLRGLSLLELGQGPGAAAAAGLESPSVWTHLVWAVDRWKWQPPNPSRS